MNRPHPSNPRFSLARGFALPAGIFLLVILAALGAFMLVLSTHQQSGQRADVQGLRAYQAARAGIEWGLFNFQRNGACLAASSFAPGGNLAGFTVTVECLPAGMAATTNESGTAVTARRIVATACNQPPDASAACPNAAPADGYIERQIEAVVTQ